MKHLKTARRAAFALALLLLLSCILTPFVFAADESTEKEEVVYVNLSPSGIVNSIDVVNIFDMNGSGKITDHGNYQNVKNMTTTDAVNVSGDTITIESSKDKLYYEGSLKSTAMPWNVTVRYYMDGKEYAADEIAGKSGALKMTMKIIKDEACPGDYFDTYALQASLSLNAEKTRHLRAPSATVANAGGNKQLSYIILPGKGADLEIQADVEDFEMSGLTINALPINMDVEVDDQELMDQIGELQEAIAQIDDGAKALRDGTNGLESAVGAQLLPGAGALSSGASSLYSGAGSLKDGASGVNAGAAVLYAGSSELKKGASALHGGIREMDQALSRLKEESAKLDTGSETFKEALSALDQALNGFDSDLSGLDQLLKACGLISRGLDELSSGAEQAVQGISYESYCSSMKENGLDPESLKQENVSASAAVSSLTDQLQEQIKSLQLAGADTSSLEAQLAQLEQVNTLLQANSAALGGMKTYLDSSNESLLALSSGTDALKENFRPFNSGLEELSSSLEKLPASIRSLTDAVGTLSSEYEKLDGGVSGISDAIAQLKQGCASLESGSNTLLQGAGNLDTGSESLYAATSSLLEGITKFYAASGSLKDGSGRLDEGIQTLLTGLVQLQAGSDALEDGTGELYSQTSGMDSQIQEKIQSLTDTITGGPENPKSFTSEENTNVDQVQFVIKTEGITVPEKAQQVAAEEKPANFLQKLLRLFGMNI